MKRIATFLIVLALLLSITVIAIADEDTLVLPENVRRIEDKAFYQTNASSAVLPEGVLTIGSQAFAYSSLKTINLPKTLTSISDDAFMGCSYLRISAEWGSYAYEWAVENGYIKCAPEWGPHRVDYTNKQLTLTLSWPYADAAYYEVYRAKAGSDMRLIGTVTPNGTGSQGFSDDTVEVGESYEYMLRLVTEKSGSVYEEGYNAPLSIELDDIYIGTYVDFSLGGVLENVSVYSKYGWSIESAPSWLSVSQCEGNPGETSIQVYGRLNNTGGERKGYIYFVSGESLAAMRIRQNGSPFGAVELQAEADESLAQIHLSWPMVPDVSGYCVYRSDYPNGEFVQIAVIDDVEYTDTEVEFGTTYFYKVLEYVDERDGTRSVGYDNGESIRVSTTSQLAAPESISITCDDPLVDMWIGDNDYLDAIIVPSVVDNDTVYWFSSDESVAYVDDTGHVFAIGVGSATITAVTVNGLSDTYDVSVIRGYPAPEVVVESIGCKTARIYWDPLDGVVSYNVYDKNEKLLGSTSDTQYIASNGSPDSKAKYYVEAVYDDGTVSRKKSDTDVFWSSPETPQLTVSEIKSSYVELTWTESATADHYYVARSSSSDMREFDVWQKVLTTTYIDTEVASGKTYYYQVSSCSWEGVGKVGSEVVAVKIPGSSTTVNPTGIELNQTDLSLNNDIKELQLTATVLPSNVTNKKVTWSSSDESIATVDSNGVVEIVIDTSGEVTITASTSNGHAASCTIEINDVYEVHTQYGAGVYVPQFSGSFGKDKYVLTVGETLQMTGYVKAPAGISRVTVKVDGYWPDGEEGANRYASKTFNGETSVTLSNYNEFSLRGKERPFNVPGLYKMKLWVSDINGNHSCVDSAYVEVKADESVVAQPTIYVTIGTNTKQYRDGEHIGTVYNDQDNWLWIDAHFTNTQRAWFRIEYPEETGLGYVHTNSYDADELYNPEAKAWSWYRKIPAGAEPGIYEIKIDAVNSSVANANNAPRTTMILTIEVADYHEKLDERIGTTIASIKENGAYTYYYNSKGNISAKAGYYGQCTWYALGRFYEVHEINLGVANDAKRWLSDNKGNEKVVIVEDPESICSKSIAVRTTGTHGHVLFVEHVSYGTDGKPEYVYYTECNADYNGVYNEGTDCILKKLSFAEFKTVKKPAGYIKKK